MAGDSGSSFIFRIAINRMPPAFAEQEAFMLFEMRQKFIALHAGMAIWIGSFSNCDFTFGPNLFSDIE